MSGVKDEVPTRPLPRPCHRDCLAFCHSQERPTTTRDGVLPESAWAQLWKDGATRIDEFADIAVLGAARDEVLASLTGDTASPGPEALRWDVPTPHRWRDDRVVWIEKRHLEGRSALQGLQRQILILREELSAELRMKGATESQIAVYHPGATGYARHLDADPADGTEGWPDQGTGDRRVTAILYLNTSWEAEHGGCLRLWKASGDKEDVVPGGASLLLFLSGCIEHQVLPLGPGSPPRVALTTWFY